MRRMRHHLCAALLAACCMLAGLSNHAANHYVYVVMDADGRPFLDYEGEYLQTLNSVAAGDSRREFHLELACVDQFGNHFTIRGTGTKDENDRVTFELTISSPTDGVVQFVEIVDPTDPDNAYPEIAFAAGDSTVSYSGTVNAWFDRD